MPVQTTPPRPTRQPPPPSLFTLTETKGDLFTLSPPSAALVHCVSQDLHMGKGIATHFKHLFGGVSVLKAQNRNVGHVAILTPLTAPRVEPHPAVYLITKQRYYGKPTLATLRASLVDLRRVCEEMGISELAMPRIGCGLDALRWDAVVSMLKEVFQGTEMRVHVFHI